MGFDFRSHFVIGVSSRALFDLTTEDEMFKAKGLEAYEEFQLKNESVLLEKGAAFPLIKAVLNLNNRLAKEDKKVEVVVMSRNSAETSLRIFNSIEHYGLNITRAALTGGAPLAPYLKAFNVALFLSQDDQDVQNAINAEVAAAIVYKPPLGKPIEEIKEIRIAFDGDAVLFSHESEEIYQSKGLTAFLQHEKNNARKPLPDGPFASLLRAISFIQKKTKGEESMIRTALVTARNSPSHERVIRTLRTWGVDINEAFFLGGANKAPILEAFRPHMFFDDQIAHCEPASRVVATSRVPIRQEQLTILKEVDAIPQTSEILPKKKYIKP